MLSGVVDYARGTLITGWARGEAATPISFSVHIDDATIKVPDSGVPAEAGQKKFRVVLPRAVTASELLEKKVTIEATQGGERLILPLWKPVEVAAMIDGMAPNGVERVISCLQPATQEALWQIVFQKHEEAEKARPDAGPLSTSAISELMRWS